jgi:hypothetical protein
MIELIFTANLYEDFPELVNFFPMRSLWNLIEWPYPRYAFQEIKDYLDIKSVLIVIGWTFVFNYLSYRKLRKADI